MTGRSPLNFSDWSSINTIYGGAPSDYKARWINMFRNRTMSALVLFIAIAFAQAALAQSPNGPKYSGDKLIFPDGFRTSWLFIGSNIGLQYKGEGRTGIAAAHANAPGPQNAFHNVYITQEGYAGFLASKTAFPDPTMFVVDIYSAKN